VCAGRTACIRTSYTHRTVVALHWGRKIRHLAHRAALQRCSALSATADGSCDGGGNIRECGPCSRALAQRAFCAPLTGADGVQSVRPATRACAVCHMDACQSICGGSADNLLRFMGAAPAKTLLLAHLQHVPLYAPFAAQCAGASRAIPRMCQCPVTRARQAQLCGHAA
jgi:hypothetical protein